jgi:hypothetical protein
MVVLGPFISENPFEPWAFVLVFNGGLVRELMDVLSPCIIMTCSA